MKPSPTSFIWRDMLLLLHSMLVLQYCESRGFLVWFTFKIVQSTICNFRLCYVGESKHIILHISRLFSSTLINPKSSFSHSKSIIFLPNQPTNPTFMNFTFRTNLRFVLVGSVRILTWFDLMQILIYFFSLSSITYTFQIISLVCIWEKNKTSLRVSLDLKFFSLKRNEMKWGWGWI
jgi:hypothetical protein